MPSTANENYWQGRPAADGIEYVYQGESAIAIEAFRAGDLDIVDVDAAADPGRSGRSDLSPNSSCSTAVASSYNLAFNLTQEPFTDIKVRQAFSQAFDRETYCGVIRNGDCLPTDELDSAGAAGFDRDRSLWLRSGSRQGRAGRVELRQCRRRSRRSPVLQQQ